MSNFISSYLPYLFLLFYIILSFKNPVFLLGIPFLIFFGSSIFIDNAKLFSVPLSYGRDIILLGWLVMTWFIFSSRALVEVGYKRTDYYAYQGINWLDHFIIGLMIISILDLLLTFRRYPNATDVLKEFFTLVSLFLGFFIIKNCFRFVNTESLQKLLYTVVIVNTTASVLYIVHQGFHIPIYQNDESPIELFQGVNITRTFWFMPVLWFFSISFLLIFRNKRAIINGVLLIINFLAIFISYTRSFLIIAVLIVFVYFFLVAHKKQSLLVFFKNSAIACLIGITSFLVVSRFRPAETNYFLDRFNELKEDPTEEEPNTLVYRFEHTNEVISGIEPGKKFIGLGPVTDKQLSSVENMEKATADLVWTGVIFRWGYVGMLLFGLLYLVSLVKAYYLFMRSDGLLSQLALVLLLTILSQIIEGFTSWTFMSPSRFAMGLWYFALLSTLMGFKRI